jgi:hypothetical protein
MLEIRGRSERFDGRRETAVFLASVAQDKHDGV